MRHLPLLAALLFACASTPKPPPIQPGELLVRVANPAAISTESFVAASGRSDFQISAVDCLSETICRLVVTRTDGIADPFWTAALIQALTTKLPDGVRSIEPNGLEEPR